MSFTLFRDKIKPLFKEAANLKKDHEKAENDARNMWSKKLEIEEKIARFDESAKASLADQPERQRQLAIGEITIEQYTELCPDRDALKVKYSGFQAMLEATVKEHKCLVSIAGNASAAYRDASSRAWMQVAEAEALDFTPSLLRCFAAYQLAALDHGQGWSYQDFLHRLMVQPLEQYRNEIEQIKSQLKNQHLVRG